MQAKTIMGLLAVGAGVGFSGYTLLTKENRWRKMGDVNGDGVIDATDRDIIAVAFGSAPGDANWNPNADLNGDNIIDIFDALTCSGHQGLDYRSWSEGETIKAVAGAGAGITVAVILLYVV